MFNLSSFNRSAFNRPTGAFFGRSTLLGSGNIEGTASSILSAAGTLTGSGSIVGQSAGEFAAALTGAGSIVGEGTLYNTLSGTLVGAGSIDIEDLEIITYSYFNYAGPLEAGDILIIDTDKKTIKKNGSNYLYFFSGEFFNIEPNSNLFKYQDGESSRSLSLESGYVERYV